MHVIGTAGHVDHGKSTLIKSLTGIDPDRLSEEKQRGMTIDLGFAWLTLPSGREAGIVDVPGHQRFIKNMLAGAGAISLVLFVVAATEGWMPQSREHFEILELLGVKNGIIVLTKVDLVEPEWIELISAEIREQCRGSFLENAAIYPVSPITGEGMSRLIAGLDETLNQIPPAPDRGKPVLWIDRVFSIKGSGTVVTGTLLGGSLRLEQEVEVLPLAKKARVRGLQTHKKAVRKAVPGSRVAINLAGVDVEELGRGQLVAGIGQRGLSDRFNAEIYVGSSSERSMEPGRGYKFYVGTAEVEASLRLFVREAVHPGETCCGQIELSNELPLQFGDRFVIRDPGANRTAGGGRILDPQAQRVRSRSLAISGLTRRERKFRETLGLDPQRFDVESLIRLSRASEPELLGYLLDYRGLIPKSDLPRQTYLGEEEVAQQLSGLAGSGRAVEFPSFVLSERAFEAASRKVLELLEEFHSTNPLKPGFPLEELRERIGAEPRFFEELIEELKRRQMIETADGCARRPGHRIELDSESEAAAREILRLFKDRGFTPPTYDELIKSGYKPELIGAMVDRGELVKVSRDLLFLPRDLIRAQKMIAAFIKENGSMSVAEVRDVLGTSRKYAVPLVEYFDRAGVTRRAGDLRVAGNRMEDFHLQVQEEIS